MKCCKLSSHSQCPSNRHLSSAVTQLVCVCEDVLWSWALGCEGAQGPMCPNPQPSCTQVPPWPSRDSWKGPIVQVASLGSPWGGLTKRQPSMPKDRAHGGTLVLLLPSAGQGRPGVAEWEDRESRGLKKRCSNPSSSSCLLGMFCNADDSQWQKGSTGHM